VFPPTVQVNQVQMRFQWSNMTLDSLACENLAPGDAKSAELARPLSVSSGSNFWPLYYNRSEMRLFLKNITYVFGSQVFVLCQLGRVEVVGISRGCVLRVLSLHARQNAAPAESSCRHTPVQQAHVWGRSQHAVVPSSVHMRRWGGVPPNVLRCLLPSLQGELDYYMFGATAFHSKLPYFKSHSQFIRDVIQTSLWKVGWQTDSSIQVIRCHSGSCNVEDSTYRLQPVVAPHMPKPTPLPMPPELQLRPAEKSPLVMAVGDTRALRVSHSSPR
jgi:hypothetical protein